MLIWQAKKQDILSRFLLEREKDPGCFDNKYLRDIILNFVIAGRDTTAGTLSWFLYVLCRDQRIQDKIAREVREATTADHRDVGGVQEFVARLTEDAIGSMHYLHAALTETLRLYPAVPTVSSLTPIIRICVSICVTTREVIMGCCIAGCQVLLLG